MKPPKYEISGKQLLLCTVGIKLYLANNLKQEPENFYFLWFRISHWKEFNRKNKMGKKQLFILISKLQKVYFQIVQWSITKLKDNVMTISHNNKKLI